MVQLTKTRLRLKLAMGLGLLIVLSPFFATTSHASCWSIQSYTPAANHNVIKYQYNSITNTWAAVDSWRDSSVENYQPRADDQFELSPSRDKWVVYTQNYSGGGSPPGGSPPPISPPRNPPRRVQSTSVESDQLSGYSSRGRFQSREGPIHKRAISGSPAARLMCLDDDEGPAELPKMTVTASSVPAWNSLLSWGYVFTYNSSGGGGGGNTPPAPDFPEECSSGDPVIDDNEDIWKELFEDSNFGDYADPENIHTRLEQGGYLIPDGDGGYDFERIGPDTRFESTHGPCEMEHLLFDDFPQGTILVHTHPFTDGEQTGSVCPGNDVRYDGRPSVADRLTLRMLENVEEGIIIDAEKIIRFQEGSIADDEEDVSRCGY